MRTRISCFAAFSVCVFLLVAGSSKAQQAIDNVSIPSAVATSAASVAGALSLPAITPAADGKTHALIGCFTDAVNSAISSVTDTGTCNGSSNWSSAAAVIIARCTGLHAPYACCTGSGTGPTCGPAIHTATTPTTLDDEIWFCPSPSAGAHTVTVTNGASTEHKSLVVMDASGMTATPLDFGTNKQNTSSSANIAAQVLNVANPSELIIGCGATAVSEASHAAFTSSQPITVVSDLLGVAPSLFTASIVSGFTVQDNGLGNYGPAWSTMATSTSSLNVTGAFIGSQQPVVTIDPAITNGNTFITVTASSISAGTSAPNQVTIANGSSTVCNRLTLCSVNSTMVTPTCGNGVNVNSLCTGSGTPNGCCTGVGTGTCVDTSGCTCSLVLGPTTFAVTAAQQNAVCASAGVPYGCCTGGGTGTCTTGTGSKAEFLCAGCLRNSIICNYGTTITDGFATADSYVEPSGGCITSGASADVTATGTASTISSTKGDMLLYDICAAKNIASGYGKLLPADTWNAASGDGPFGQLSDFYPVTATGTTPAENIQNGLTNGAVGVVGLSATSTSTATPTPAGACTPNATINLLNSSNKIMNGGASATNGPGAQWGAQATDITGNIVNAFTGTASATTGSQQSIVQIVDNSGNVCLGTNASGTPANAQFTVRVCNSSHQVAPCLETGTPAKFNMSVQIQDANGKIDDTF